MFQPVPRAPLRIAESSQNHFYDFGLYSNKKESVRICSSCCCCCCCCCQRRLIARKLAQYIWEIFSDFFLFLPSLSLPSFETTRAIDVWKLLAERVCSSSIKLHEANKVIFIAPARYIEGVRGAKYIACLPICEYLRSDFLYFAFHICLILFSSVTAKNTNLLRLLLLLPSSCCSL